MLIDEFNRVINYVRISITDRCNLRCKYCIDGTFPFIPHNEMLSYEEIIRFVKICAELGVSKIRFTGGETLTLRDISHLIEEINKINGIKDISLTTNGVLLGKNINDLKDAGLRRVNISLDTLKKDKFAYITGVDAFTEVIRSIKKAHYSGLSPIKINSVIIKGFNDDEILDFAKLSIRYNHHIRFIEYMPFGDSGLWDRSKIVTSSEIEARIREAYELESSVNNEKGPAKMFNIKGAAGKIGFISPISSHICSECNRIRLTSNGRIRPCLFSDVGYNVKKLLREGKSDEEIKSFIIGIVKVKPERKDEIGQIKKCQRSLQHIGG
jgi:cyclic pyranopterin phosphate synthase